MPLCPVDDSGMEIFYRTYGRGPVKVLLIIGLAGTHGSWGPQVGGLAGTVQPNDEVLGAALDGGAGAGDNGVEVCAFDNRGAGRSSVPTDKSEYTTKIMAKDAIDLLDHLGWERAHVIGHSMGAMIACKLAAMVPGRVLSLGLLNVTGGGVECFPKIDRRTISIAIRFLRAKTPEQRADVDLDTHYSKEYLEEYVGSSTRRAVLHQEYVKSITTTGLQSNYGFQGQINACRKHRMTRTEIELIRSAGFPVSIIHGRHDVVAQICHARSLAEKLKPVARMIELDGGHLVSHERIKEVNEVLLELIKASEMKVVHHFWTALPNKSSGLPETSMSVARTHAEGELLTCLADGIIERINFFLWHFFGWLIMGFESGRKAMEFLKPIKVQPALTYSHI
ncbi:putative aminoacrylate hydrolase RutD isoform X1 [Rhodamnia argentea]|uniref:Aminoacrylate hydrolase RutD isoform X1 n=1 Tax=Rhodamnia argentea TaxID=178133 RepID=A0A8B8PE54_9MYRT|nr:putative aminoacrylate hydrolase RutD isoform X1 [Rhodamnia argentea]